MTRATRLLAGIGALSALMLLLEMALVRWIGTEIRIFAYIQNGVLVASFLGIGLGARNARRPVRALPAVAALALIALLILDPLHLGLAERATAGLASFGDTSIWLSALDRGLANVGLALAITLFLLVLVVVAFAPLGQRLGSWMDQSPAPITSYSVNVAGSLMGIAAFDALTLLRTPPTVWLLVAGLGMAAVAWTSDEKRELRLAAVVIALGLPLLAIHPTVGREIWSPYQKLAYSRHHVRDAAGTPVDCGGLVTVNNVGYQLVLELDPQRMASLPAVYPPDEIWKSHYRLPYDLMTSSQANPRALHRALLVGSGTGNDVAGALFAGVEQIDAVEIDPAIIDLGREANPDQPYQSPKVHLFNDDARAFFRKATPGYDVVWFGLLDSHTTPSAYTNVRLDHFVYTRESMEDVRRLLAPGGLVVLYFEAQTPWIADRLHGLMQETFGTEPITMSFRPATSCLGWGGMLLLSGDEAALAPLRARIASEPRVAALQVASSSFTNQVRIPTDNWPYLYLRAAGIPAFQLLVGVLCLAIALLLRKRLFRPGEPLDLPMLLLGAGFMLVEVTAVSRAALLYGTTWTVNAYVVSAILVMILVANTVAARVRPAAVGWPLMGLAASLLVLAIVPPSAMASLPPLPRVLAGSTFLVIPVFFSGLVFVDVWAKSTRKDLALGSNLVGSLIGGVASLSTMLIGFQALILVALVIYLAAGALLRRQQPA